MASTVKGKDFNPRMIAKVLSSLGRKGDTQLAHVNSSEMNLLKQYGGSGTVNPSTGLKEFEGGGLQGGKNNGNKIGAGHDDSGGHGGGQGGGKNGGVRNQTSGKYGAPEADQVSRDSAAQGAAVGRTVGASDQQSAALKLAQDQRKIYGPIFNAGATAIGAAAPGPFGAVGSLLKLGNWMGQQAESALGDDPGAIKTTPGDPSAVSGMTKNGLMSNRPRSATPGTAGLGGQAGAQDQNNEAEEERQRKLAAQRTVLGATSSPLGTPLNPMKI